ncbi:hypothetical protein AN191_09300 [Loktanella sp. 5RATIMAR09]|uniref:GGDEF domain-containing protein n=1 Tax=Loktanella sp. 5RATIMAR09 TaxID=1225655 RepID=UPI0007071EC3|nr:GGDEF domain-containing protein [Loktanella sp. 5RATIMAR09]KQI72304.1 hypothetical protein AN191_09300 [Loktanella sp. 5RATIMAR09]
MRLTAPTGKFDFLVKLTIFILISGLMNHVRHFVVYGLPGQKTYWENLGDATFTALPMCTFALLLIGHLNALQKRLYLQATRDALTDLPNRRWFMDKTPERILPTQAIMIIDVDRFKDINDTFGHDIGDLCLRRMASHLNTSLEQGDILARVGGEEFAAFLEQADDAKLQRIATRMSEGMAFGTSQGSIQRVTASVGVVRSDEIILRRDAMRLADKAVYEAKSAGRACYRICLAGHRNEMQQVVPAALSTTSLS